MLRLRIILGVFGFVACTSLALAQASGHHLTAEMIDITLEPAGPCDHVSAVSVVMNKDESTSFRAVQDKSDPCHWTATRPTFYVESMIFSLRLGSARTQCKVAQGSAATRVAKLTFRCCRTGARQVDLETTPEMSVKYIRSVPADLDVEEGSVPCEEEYRYSGQPVIIQSVWFPREAFDSKLERAQEVSSLRPVETVRIRLGYPDSPSLILNHASFMRRIDPKTNTLSAAQILLAHQEQRSKGISSMPEGFSVAADDAEWKELIKTLRLKSVKVLVK